mmetsp:Transcript_36556/g.81199  ORF Transcript_36556/g.81199 Transcript_36556/m.81199 type:complete len:434 (-) Transcript_36556:555-1856(-)
MADTTAPWVFSEEKLGNALAGRDAKKEKETRSKTVWFMNDLSDVLRPPPRQRDRKEDEIEYDIGTKKVFWTACIFFHRFYVYHTFEETNRFSMAVACLFLAAKVEERPLRLSDHVFLYFRVRKNKQLKKTDAEFKAMEKEVLVSERLLLQCLNFDLNVVSPHSHFRRILARELKPFIADPDDGKQLQRLATMLATDSLRSTLCLLYSPHQLAFSLVFMSLILMSLEPSRAFSGRGVVAEVSWVEIFEKDVDEEVLQGVCTAVVELYADASQAFRVSEKLGACVGAVVERVGEEVERVRQGRLRWEAANPQNPHSETEEFKNDPPTAPTAPTSIAPLSTPTAPSYSHSFPPPPAQPQPEQSPLSPFPHQSQSQSHGSYYADGVEDTPSWVPPPPDTPGSLAATPNFDHLTRPGSVLNASVMLDHAFSKKARVEY